MGKLSGSNIFNYLTVHSIPSHKEESAWNGLANERIFLQRLGINVQLCANSNGKASSDREKLEIFMFQV